MDIIDASKTTKYKVFKWLLVGLGALVFVVGIVLNITGRNVTATSMSFDMGGQITKSAADNIWRANVWERETTLIVNTEPANLTGSPVTFEVTRNNDGFYGNNYIEPIAPVRSGRPAEIRLKANDGTYAFDKYVTITVSCGNITEILEIKILPPSDQMGVRVSVKEGDKQLSLMDGAYEISEETYLVHRRNVSGLSVSYYQLDAGLFVYNTRIHEVDDSFTEECEEEGVGLTLDERNRFVNSEGVTLLGGTRGLLIDDEFLLPGEEYHFRVSCIYLGVEYFKLVALRII